MTNHHTKRESIMTTPSSTNTQLSINLSPKKYLLELFKTYEGVDFCNDERVKTQLKNFVLHKLISQADDADPKISQGALNILARTTVVGLMEPAVTVNIATLSTEALEAKLIQQLSKLRKRNDVIEG